MAVLMFSTCCGSVEVPLSGPIQHRLVQRVSVPSLAYKSLQKGKTHIPQNLLPLQKRGFLLLSKLSMEVIQGAQKISIGAFFSLYFGKISSHGDSLVLP